MDSNHQSDAEEGHLRRGTEKVKGLWEGFVDFAFSGNILEIAFGLILAAAFTTLVNSFVTHLIMPIISLAVSSKHELDQMFVVLRKGHEYNKDFGYHTLQQAIDDGAVVFAYGAFLHNLLMFLILGLALYVLALLYQWCSHDNIIKRTKKCTYCRKRVNVKSIRCINCTSWLDGREDKKQSANLMD